MLRLFPVAQHISRQLSFAKRHGTSISVILLENLEKRGQKGEVIDVKRGFARNFLVPRKKAAYATVLNQQKYKYLAEQTAEEAAQQAAALKPHHNLFNFVSNNQTLSIARDSSPETKTLYSAVTEEEIIKAFANINVPANNVKIAVPIKALGEYKVVVDTLNVSLNVVSK